MSQIDVDDPELQAHLGLCSIIFKWAWQPLKFCHVPDHLVAVRDQSYQMRDYKNLYTEEKIGPVVKWVLFKSAGPCSHLKALNS